MTYMTGFYHPQKAFKAWKYFVDNIDAYNSANWFTRLFKKNPWRYVCPW